MTKQEQLDMVQAINECENLTDWERSFMEGKAASIEKWGGLTDKQMPHLEKIHQERVVEGRVPKR
jgi:hypothetical protein